MLLPALGGDTALLLGAPAAELPAALVLAMICVIVRTKHSISISIMDN
jgi:hypothetical protein